ncbi:unnamed protein product [Closterium sp. Naga37s-1]|nr:unnamed protein product [Closterium sp. Naga37s-1]
MKSSSLTEVSSPFTAVSSPFVAANSLSLSPTTAAVATLLSPTTTSARLSSFISFSRTRFLSFSITTSSFCRATSSLTTVISPLNAANSPLTNPNSPFTASLITLASLSIAITAARTAEISRAAAESLQEPRKRAETLIRDTHAVTLPGSGRPSLWAHLSA